MLGYTKYMYKVSKTTSWKITWGEKLPENAPSRAEPIRLWSGPGNTLLSGLTKYGEHLCVCCFCSLL